jgi:hypothetical protein
MHPILEFILENLGNDSTPQNQDAALNIFSVIAPIIIKHKVLHAHFIHYNLILC